MEPNIILAGVDGSARASLVLAAAADLSRRFGAALHVVRAVELARDVPTDEPLASEDGRAEAAARAAERELEALIAARRAAGDAVEGARCEVRFGVPADVLVEVAGELRPRFLVIGAHGHSAWKRVLGTTAARVVEAAPCSVVAVRDASREGGG